MTEHQIDILMWAGFGVLVLGALVVDLGLFQRKAHVVRAKEALIWTLVWIALAMAFNVGIWYFKGATDAQTFLAGYILEKSLSVDNLFIFLVIFASFGVPKEYESRILMWGILGALVMRALFIWGGIALIERFGWMMYVFGVILILTGFKLLLKKEGEVHPEKNIAVRFARKFLPTTDKMDGQKFFTVVDGKRLATPLFVVLLVVETTDVIFAVDSIPAILGITQDPFIVYTSNVFAILGLRALYFLLARMMNLFRFLKYALIIILWFIGAKMLLAKQIHLSPAQSVLFIGAVLTISIVLSLLFREKHGGDEPPVPKTA